MGKNIGLCKCPIKYSHEFSGTFTLSMSKSTHSVKFLTLNPEHWLFSNFYQKIPFKAIKYLLLISLMSKGSICSDCNPSIRLDWISYFFMLGISIDARVFESCPTISFNCSIPDFRFTSSQFDLLSCLLVCKHSTFLYKSLTHSFMNFLKSFTFIYDFLHNPIFFITYPQVGPFISSVRKAQPAIRNKLMIRVFNRTA